MNNAKFELQQKLAADGKTLIDVEWVRIQSGIDEVVREATDEDRRLYKNAYSQFKAPPVAPEVAPESAPEAAEAEPAEVEAEAKPKKRSLFSKG